MNRVLHLVSSADRRGAQVFAWQLAAELGGPPLHEVVAVAPASTNNPLELAHLGRRRTDARGMARLVAGLRNSDLLVAHGSSALLHGLIAGTLAGRPFIYRNIGDPSAWGAVRGADQRIGLPLRRAAAVSALYPHARTHLIETYGLEPDRVTTIPNAVPQFPAPSAARRSAARRELLLDDDLEWVGFVGALSEEKGVLRALDVVRSDPGLGLVVAGDGPQAALLEDLVQADLAVGARNRVRVVGVIDDPRSVLDAIDVLVVPSRTEGIPAVAIEAGLCGVPVVATDVGGLREVVLDGVTGVLVADPSPASLRPALRHALANKGALGAAARRRCEERFTMEQVAVEWSDLIDRVRDGQEGAASSR